jgi:hypothetical protein
MLLKVNAAGFNSPQGVAVDTSVTPNRIYVADSQNNRVLGWSSVPNFLNGASADIVIGQPNFTTSTANNGGVSANSLNNPSDVAVDLSGNLYVADTANNRVLEYNSPFTTDTTADFVFGQGTQTAQGPTSVDSPGRIPRTDSRAPATSVRLSTGQSQSIH